MSRHLTSAKLAEAIRRTDFSARAATVIGYGNMGKQYVGALRALGVKRLRVCSRSPERLADLRAAGDVEVIDGGFERLTVQPTADEVGFIATPTAFLIAAAERLADLGFRRLLIEKPVALVAADIDRLALTLKQRGIMAWCAFNRITYPGVYEALARAEQEGGITSCTYTFTEFVNRIGPGKFPDDELARWGIANSLHVMSLAHALIGLPTQWGTFHSGAITWHPSGAVFTGAGLSAQGIPFSYQADWGSTGRWSVEIHTHVSSYRFCPLEQLARRVAFNTDWEDVPLTVFAPSVKVGFVEQVAVALAPDVEGLRPLASLEDTAALTRFGEDVFGYSQRHRRLCDA